jgi:hypothetical protein
MLQPASGQLAHKKCSDQYGKGTEVPSQVQKKPAGNHKENGDMNRQKPLGRENLRTRDLQYPNGMLMKKTSSAAIHNNLEFMNISLKIPSIEGKIQFAVDGLQSPVSSCQWGGMREG